MKSLYLNTPWSPAWSQVHRSNCFFFFFYCKKEEILFNMFVAGVRFMNYYYYVLKCILNHCYVYSLGSSSCTPLHLCSSRVCFQITTTIKIISACTFAYSEVLCFRSGLWSWNKRIKGMDWSAQAVWGLSLMRKVFSDHRFSCNWTPVPRVQARPGTPAVPLGWCIRGCADDASLSGKVQRLQHPSPPLHPPLPKPLLPSSSFWSDH